MKQQGFTLIEAVFALLILSLLGMAVLQVEVLCIRVYELSEDRWVEAIDAWNQGQRLLTECESSPGSIPDEQVLGLHRHRIEVMGETGGWELLHHAP